MKPESTQSEATTQEFEVPRCPECRFPIGSNHEPGCHIVDAKRAANVGAPELVEDRDTPAPVTDATRKCAAHCGHDTALRNSTGGCGFVLGYDGTNEQFEVCGHICSEAPATQSGCSECGEIKFHCAESEHLCPFVPTALTGRKSPVLDSQRAPATEPPVTLSSGCKLGEPLMHGPRPYRWCEPHDRLMLTCDMKFRRPPPHKAAPALAPPTTEEHAEGPLVPASVSFDPEDEAPPENTSARVFCDNEQHPNESVVKERAAEFLRTSAPQPPERITIYTCLKCNRTHVVSLAASLAESLGGCCGKRIPSGTEYVRADIAASRADDHAALYQAIADCLEGQASHRRWIDYINDPARSLDDGVNHEHVGDIEHQIEWVKKYDNILACLRASRADVDAFHRGVNAAKDAIRSEDGDGCPNFCASIFINAIARKCGNDPGVAVDAAQGDILKERQRCALIAEAVNDSMRDEGKFARNILNPDTCLIPRSRGTYAISPEHVFDNRGQCVYCAEYRAAPPLAVEQECEALKTLNILESEMRASAEREATELASTISNVRGVLQLLPEGLQTDSRFKPYLSALLAALQSTADSACAKCAAHEEAEAGVCPEDVGTKNNHANPNITTNR